MMPLTRQVERWMRDMNILNRVGKALVAQLDLESVAGRTIEASIYITRADHAFLILLEANNGSEPYLCAVRAQAHVKGIEYIMLCGPNRILASSLEANPDSRWRNGQTDNAQPY